MSRGTATLHIYVVGVDNGRQSRASDRQCAYGISFDSQRYMDYNASYKLWPGRKGPFHSQTALYEGITAAIRDAPPYHSLIIETDDKAAAAQLNWAILERNKVKDKARKQDEEVREESRDETAILDLIAIRNKRGGFFADIIFSGDDLTAQRGLQAARDLALKALAGRCIPLS